MKFCRELTLRLIAIICIISSPHKTCAADSWKFTHQKHNFGTVILTANQEHTFTFENRGSETLVIKRVTVQSPLKFVETTPSIPPSESGTVRVRIEENADPGPIDAQITVEFRDESIESMTFHATGKIVQPIEFVPFKAVFVTTFRGATNAGHVEIVNHTDASLEILETKTDCPNCTITVEPVEAGKRYRLQLTLDGKTGPVGKHEYEVSVATSNQNNPELILKAFTFLKERVYTFPDRIDFGQISQQALSKQPELLPYLSQTLMVYQKGGTNFEVSIETDIPFLKLTSEKSQFGDRYEITLNVIPEKISEGKVDGKIVIDTNDDEFPQVVVPVNAECVRGAD